MSDQAMEYLQWFCFVCLLATNRLQDKRFDMLKKRVEWLEKR